MHLWMKALQPSRLRSVAFPPPDCSSSQEVPPWVGAIQQMSSSLKGHTLSGAGCQPRWSWEATVTFLGLALPRRAKKKGSSDFRQKLSLVDADDSPKYLIKCNALNTKVVQPARFSGVQRLKKSTDEPHAGKLARVVLAGDPGILY
jgi:hypothetical protein